MNPSPCISCSNTSIRPAILLYNDSERSIADGIVHRMVKRAIELEGTATGEHGVGLVKRDYLPYELGQDTVDAMRKVCVSFSPFSLRLSEIFSGSPDYQLDMVWLTFEPLADSSNLRSTRCVYSTVIRLCGCRNQRLERCRSGDISISAYVAGDGRVGNPCIDVCLGVWCERSFVPDSAGRCVKSRQTYGGA